MSSSPDRLQSDMDSATALHHPDGFLVVTGGLNTEPYVTQYHLDGGNECSLTRLGQPRRSHACGVFRDADDQQVS